MNSIRLNIWWLSILFIYMNLSAQSFDFVSEKIIINIERNRFEVIGTYNFYNPHSSEIHSALYYPFPISDFSFPKNINVSMIGAAEKIPFRQKHSAISFPVGIPAESFAAFRVRYEQKTNSDRAEYILTSTKQWSKPLKKGEYIISLPDSLKLTFLSYKADSVYSEKNRKYFKFKRNNFLPEKNIIIKWRSNEN